MLELVITSTTPATIRIPPVPGTGASGSTSKLNCRKLLASSAPYWWYTRPSAALVNR